MLSMFNEVGIRVHDPQQLDSVRLSLFSHFGNLMNECDDIGTNTERQSVSQTIDLLDSIHSQPLAGQGFAWSQTKQFLRQWFPKAP